MNYFTDKVEIGLGSFAPDTTEAVEYFRRMADAMSDIIWQADTEGNLRFMNRAWYDLTGLTSAETLDKGYTTALAPASGGKSELIPADALKSGAPFEKEIRVRRANGSAYFWHLVKGSPVYDSAKKITGWIGTCTNIQAQKHLDEQLRERASDIEGLNERLRRAMQETHHRIKNNLQVVAAIAEMHLGETDVSAQPVLQRIGQHIRTLALLHDMFTREMREGNEAISISARAILEELVLYLQTSLHHGKLSFQAEDVDLSLEQSAAVALLINELISNSVKHGGQDIEVSLCQEGSSVRLDVTDDGPGFPADFMPEHAGNTGLEIIQSLARWDLRGSIAFRNLSPRGARVTVMWPQSNK